MSWKCLLKCLRYLPSKTIKAFALWRNLIAQKIKLILPKFFFFSVAPSSLDLNGPSEARVGDVINYECVTANSNPPATIQWVVDNRTQSGSSGIQSQSLVSPLGGWVTHSNLSIKVQSNDRTKLISCNVVNSELNDVKTESAILTVICKYRPCRGPFINDVTQVWPLPPLLCQLICPFAHPFEMLALNCLPLPLHGHVTSFMNYPCTLFFLLNSLTMSSSSEC